MNGVVRDCHTSVRSINNLTVEQGQTGPDGVKIVTFWVQNPFKIKIKINI